MSVWDRVPEYLQLKKEMFAENEKVSLEEREYWKQGKGEFCPAVHDFFIKWNKIIDDFQNKYRKEHPEEFDENGNFKEDTK